VYPIVVWSTVSSYSYVPKFILILLLWCHNFSLLVKTYCKLPQNETSETSVLTFMSVIIILAVLDWIIHITIQFMCQLNFKLVKRIMNLIYTLGSIVI